MRLFLVLKREETERKSRFIDENLPLTRLASKSVAIVTDSALKE